MPGPRIQTTGINSPHGKSPWSIRLAAVSLTLVFATNAGTAGAATTTAVAGQSPHQTLQIAQLSARLRAATVVSGRFIQQREVKGLNQPLVSSGEFIYWRDRGIYWQTDLPFPQAVTYNNQQTLVWAAAGVPAKGKYNSRKDRQFRHILLTMFSFDLTQLQQQFSSQWQLGDQQWQLQLTPTNSLTRRALKSASLSGQQFIQQIIITNQQGEQLQIGFSAMQSDDAISESRCVSLFGYSAEECQQAGLQP